MTTILFFPIQSLHGMASSFNLKSSTLMKYNNNSKMASLIYFVLCAKLTVNLYSFYFILDELNNLGHPGE